MANNKNIELTDEEIDSIIYSLKSVKMDANKQLVKLVQLGANVNAQKIAIDKMDAIIYKLEKIRKE